MPPSQPRIDSKRLDRSERYQFAVSLIYCLPVGYVLPMCPVGHGVPRATRNSRALLLVPLNLLLINRGRFVSFVSDRDGGSGRGWIFDMPGRPPSTRIRPIVDRACLASRGHIAVTIHLSRFSFPVPSWGPTACAKEMRRGRRPLPRAIAVSLFY